MSIKKDSLSKSQIKSRPNIHDVIGDILCGEKLMLALEFIAYLEKRKLKLRWASANTWVAKYKGANIIYIRLTGAEFFTTRDNIESRSWLISPPFDLNNDYDFKETIWANVNYCIGCIKCKPGNTFEILGKEFSHVCHSIINFINPGNNEIDCAKYLLDCGMKDAEEAAARNGTQSKPLFSTETVALTRIDNNTSITDVTGTPGIPCANLFNSKYAMFYSRGKCEVFFSAGEPIMVKMYGLVTYKEDALPTSWTLYGAATGDGPWKPLDTRHKADGFIYSICHYAESVFQMSSPNTYQHYKLTFEADGTFFLSQIHFYV